MNRLCAFIASSTLSKPTRLTSQLIRHTTRPLHLFSSNESSNNSDRFQQLSQSAASSTNQNNLNNQPTQDEDFSTDFESSPSEQFSNHTNQENQPWSNEIDEEFERELKEQQNEEEEVQYESINETDDFNQSSYESESQKPVSFEEQLQILNQKIEFSIKSIQRHHRQPSSKHIETISTNFHFIIKQLESEQQQQLDETINSTFKCISNYIQLSSLCTENHLHLSEDNRNTITKVILQRLQTQPSETLSFEFFQCLISLQNKGILTADESNSFSEFIIKNKQQLSTQVLILLLRKMAQSEDESIRSDMIAQILVRIPQINSIEEFLTITPLLSLKDFKSNNTLLKSYLRHFSKFWPHLTGAQALSTVASLNLLPKRLFSPFLQRLDEAIRVNMHSFKPFEISLLLRFYQKSAAEFESDSNTSPIMHELVTRRCELLITSAHEFLRKVNSLSSDSYEHVVVPTEIVDKLTEIAQIQNQLTFFKTANNIHKRTVNKITSSIHSDNPQLDQFTKDIVNHTITNFEFYSTLLCILNLRQKPILLQLSKQLASNLDIDAIALPSLLQMYKNFRKLNLHFPFTQQLQEKLIVSSNEIDLTNPIQWQNTFQFVCEQSITSSEQNPSELINLYEMSLIEAFQPRTSRYNYDSILEHLTFLPPNTFQNFTSDFIEHQFSKLSKRQANRCIPMLAQQNKLSQSAIETNPQVQRIFAYQAAQLERQLQQRVKQFLLSPAEVDFYMSLKSVADRFYKNLTILPYPHFVEGNLIKIIITSKSKTLHVDLLAPTDVYINDHSTLTPKAVFKQRCLAERNVQYDNITYQSFFSQDREVLVKEFLHKHFSEAE